jgi:hypothetical protein
MDKIVLVIIIIVVAVAAGFFVWQHGVTNAPVTPTPLPSGIVLFYSPNCPHCQDVEKFLTENNIAQKVKYTELEVPFAFKTSTQLQANAELAVGLAQQCKLDVSQGISIPFLYDPSTDSASSLQASSGQAGKCYLGEVDIPNFFKAQAGIK